MTTPPNPGIDTNDQTLIDAWWTPGWTAQNKAYTLASQGVNPPGPPTFTKVQIQHGYFDEDQSALSGFLTFMPSESCTLTQGSNSYRLPARLSGTTTMSPFATGYNWRNESAGQIYIYRGQLYVALMPTDLTGLVTDSGNALTYLVTEHFLGGQKFSITVPSASSNPVDLYSLIVSGSKVPYVYDPTNVFGDETAAPITYTP